MLHLNYEFNDYLRGKYSFYFSCKKNPNKQTNKKKHFQVIVNFVLKSFLVLFTEVKQMLWNT